MGEGYGFLELSDKDKFWRDNSRGPGSFGIKMHLDAFGHILTHLNMFGRIWTGFGQVWTGFGRVWKVSGGVWRSLEEFEEVLK